ncbi:hypothetical protein GCU56_14135 [Geodermatophilus sabuli]|uniref:Uncharacterized protein n=2 Tax=Geodermatophilus sabuli TaxID=1564158 RepID=A0A7K3W597_9ACTN|nr:hypothetical protein [Geodermatophilus sabuli]
MLLWPTVAVLGFVTLAGLVIALGRGSTARYEYERNSVAAQRRQPVAAAVPAAASGGSAGGPAGDPPRQAGRGASAPAAGGQLEQRTAVGVAAHPAGKRSMEGASDPAWWLVDESGDERVTEIVAGPFADRLEADWAALANGLADTVRPVHGVQRADGALARRQSPQERAWLAELGAHLDRLPEDWDELLSDTDALTTLVVEVGAALIEAGLPLHDWAGCGPDGGGPGGGVCLTPDLGSGGILVSWRQHDRMSLQQVRGAAVDAAVQETMNAAVATVLAQLGFRVEALDSSSCYRVTAVPED